MGIGRILVAIVGALIILVSLPITFGGGTILAATGAITDSDGYMSSGALHLARDSYAITTGSANIHMDSAGHTDWWPTGLLTLRVTATNSDPSRPVFIGVADTSNLSAYLKNVPHDEVRDVAFSGASVATQMEYRHHAGTATPQPPASQRFWVATASGQGTQTLEWPLESGRYTLVVMNADGTPNIDVEVSLGAKTPIVPWVGGGLIAGGLVGLIIGGLAVVLALRRS